MSQYTAEQLRFPPVEGLSRRADFDGGALSSDFGVMLLRGIDHPLVSLFAQQTCQIACGYADGNDANPLRRDSASQPESRGYRNRRHP